MHPVSKMREMAVLMTHEPATASTVEDQTAICAVLAGDRNAYGVLVRRHGPRVHAVLLRTLGNRMDADDVLQETFLRAYAKLSSFRGTSSFVTWLVRIALNLGKNQHVRVKRRETVPLEACAPEEFSELRDPADGMTRQEDRMRVQNALAALSSNHREILVLREMQEFSYQEISRMLNCPMGTVMSRLSHARKAMAQQLDGDDDSQQEKQQ